jgi:hypothetical protein
MPSTRFDLGKKNESEVLTVSISPFRLESDIRNVYLTQFGPKVDSPSFYQGVYSAVVYSETKNNNKMHTLCCRNVQSSASASRRQLRAERASKCRLVGEPREAWDSLALCMPRRAPHRLTNPSVLVRLSHHTPTPEPKACRDGRNE